MSRETGVDGANQSEPAAGAAASNQPRDAPGPASGTPPAVLDAAGESPTPDTSTPTAAPEPDADDQGADDPAPAAATTPDEKPVAGAAPSAYVPDPAGTRPKVPAGSPAPGPPSPPGRGAGRPLGQTFRALPAAAGAGSPPVADRPDDPSADAPLDVPPESPHAPRFQFILGALLALGLSAIAITAYALGSGRDPLPTDWSAWHPTSSGIQAAGEIANHVAAEYRQPGTGQLLAVKGGPLALAGVPVTIALKTGAAATGGISVLSGNAVLYKMCGLGPSCTISGKASAERLLLVRREALELALYTFNYVSGADQVVVFLPPVQQTAPVAGHPKKVKVSTTPTDAVFFTATELSGELSHPLASTLTHQAPSLTTVDQAPDTALVDQLTSPSFYKFSFVQTSQDASLFLVLEPFAVGN